MFERISAFENLERQGLRGSITNEMGEPYTLERLKAEKQENELLLNKTRKEIGRDRLLHVGYGVQSSLVWLFACAVFDHFL